MCRSLTVTSCKIANVFSYDKADACLRDVCGKSERHDVSFSELSPREGSSVTICVIVMI